MRKQFLIPFCAIVVLLAVMLIWLTTYKERTHEQLSEAQTQNTNASAAESPVRQGVATMQTNSAAKITSSKLPEYDLTTEAEKNAKARQMLEARNHPVELWAKVVDQDGVPLSDVKVETEINHFFWPPEQAPNGITTKQEIITDADGRFHVSDNSATGIHVMLVKSGYDQEERNGYGSGGQNGSQENPAILKMWSTNIHEQLITGDKSFEIQPDGKPHFINLTDGTLSDESGGDLKVWIQYTNQVVRGQLYDWSAGIEAINGGLLEVPQAAMNSGFIDQFTILMYVAPTDGYLSSFQHTGQIKGGQSGEIGDRYFYLLINNGKEYGRMHINLFAPYGRLHPGLIRLSYAINPSGSRILR